MEFINQTRALALHGLTPSAVAPSGQGFMDSRGAQEWQENYKAAEEFQKIIASVIRQDTHKPCEHKREERACENWFLSLQCENKTTNFLFSRLYCGTSRLEYLFDKLLFSSITSPLQQPSAGFAAVASVINICCIQQLNGPLMEWTLPLDMLAWLTWLTWCWKQLTISRNTLIKSDFSLHFCSFCTRNLNLNQTE